MYPEVTRTVCPTPFVLGPVCARGEREYPSWRTAPNSAELLGTYSTVMADIARYIFSVVVPNREVHSQVRIFSGADGCFDDTATDLQAKRVPTSVMLAHALALCEGAWQDQRTQVHVYGGDVRNPVSPWWQEQRLPWCFPSWVGHRFVAMDNTGDFVSQLFSTSQCRAETLFDVVLIRQGLCFCDDPSKFSPWWPSHVWISADQPNAACGLYALEPLIFDDGRPRYKKDRCILQWSTERVEWAIADVAGGVWAFARGDVGHPVLARGPWAVWNGTTHANDASFACGLQEPLAPPPWQRPPNGRICCCGIGGDTPSLLVLLQRVASVLDTRHANSFGLLHGAWTNGTRTEVDQLHQQIEEAVRLFNDQWRGPHVATVLWRTAAQEYWLKCDGVILFQPGSNADPYKAYAQINYEAYFGPKQ